MKTPEQLARYAATRKAKLHALALSSGRDPVLVGRPRSLPPQEKAEKHRLRIRKARARKKAEMVANGWAPSKPGPKPLPPEEQKNRRLVTYARFRMLHLERRRDYEAEWSRQKRCSEGYTPIKRSLSALQLEAKRIAMKKWRSSQSVDSLRQKAANHYGANKDTYKAWSRNRRARLRSAEGSHTVADIADLMVKQKGKCTWCLKRFGEQKPHVDHRVPLALGGSNDIRATCNFSIGFVTCKSTPRIPSNTAFAAACSAGRQKGKTPMFTDQSLLFAGTNWSTPATITGSGSSTIVDLTGAGSGNAPAMIGGYPAVNTAMGFDIAYGDGEARPTLYCSFPTVGTGSGTLTIALESAPDNGSYSPGSYTVLWQSQAITGTSFTAGGIISLPVPPTPLGYTSPRFYKLLYTVSGTVSVAMIAGLVINPQSSLVGPQFSSNFIAV